MKNFWLADINLSKATELESGKDKLNLHLLIPGDVCWPHRHVATPNSFLFFLLPGAGGLNLALSTQPLPSGYTLYPVVCA